MLRITVFVSGGGTNLQAVIDFTRKNADKAVVAAVISNNSRAFALQRAASAEIPAYHISRATIPDENGYCAAIMEILAVHRTNLIVLAGYMKLLPAEIVRNFYGRIINIHPALLPKYGGPGMYGEHVHRAVLAAGEKYSGATVHMVDEKYDHGPILIQRRVPVMPDDTPESLAARVLQVEHQILPEAVGLFIK